MLATKPELKIMNYTRNMNVLSVKDIRDKNMNKLNLYFSQNKI